MRTWQQCLKTVFSWAEAASPLQVEAEHMEGQAKAFEELRPPSAPVAGAEEEQASEAASALASGLLLPIS